MGLFEDLAGNLDKNHIEATTFSIDALGHQICSPWAEVEKANTSQPQPAVRCRHCRSRHVRRLLC